MSARFGCDRHHLTAFRLSLRFQQESHFFTATAAVWPPACPPGDPADCCEQLTQYIQVTLNQNNDLFLSSGFLSISIHFKFFDSSGYHSSAPEQLTGQPSRRTPRKSQKDFYFRENKNLKQHWQPLGPLCAYGLLRPRTPANCRRSRRAPAFVLLFFFFTSFTSFHNLTINSCHRFLFAIRCYAL